MCGFMVASVIAFWAQPGGTVENDRPVSDARGADDSSAEKKDDRRIREGAKFENRLGEFREAGERIRFYMSDDKTSFVAIENLALERVSRVLEGSTSPRSWSVSGVVTEFRGSNYLIVTRAALKAHVKKRANTGSRK